MIRPFLFRPLACAAVLLVAVHAAAQDPPPKIGPFVVDLHGTVPRFPNDAQLAESRGVTTGELPGVGLGAHAAVNLYLLKWKAITFGVGLDGAFARAHRGARAIATTQTTRAVTERFMHGAPDLSFNFGSGDGWSYLSGGIGSSVWSVLPDGEAATPPDTQRLRTINYGGGARWFSKRHVAFSFDVRFYAVYPGTSGYLGRPGGPRTTLLFMGGGISVK